MTKSTSGITLFSPAKLNLFFRVLRKREDGYHEIASLFQAVSLGDFLHVETAESEALFCNHPSLPSDHSNLVLKAAALFRRKSGLSFYAHFYLVKHIPLEAGLGGGSSNAATALWALNELAGRPASRQQLCEWAAEIGSDVAFFFSKGSAYCTGRGELVKEVPFKNMSLWIAKPTEGIETPAVFKQCNPDALPQRNPIETLDHFFTDHPVYFNDLEEATFQLMPALETFKQKLLSLGFETVVMTGSGTSFFCLGDVSEPRIENAVFFKVDTVAREDGEWYELPSSVRVYR